MSVRARLLVVLLATLASACGKAKGAPASSGSSGPPGSIGSAGASGASGAALADSVRPPGDRELPPTGGRIALGNLDAQIRGAEAAIAKDPAEIDTRLKLVDLLSTRGMLLAKITDYERALALSEALVEGVKDAPGRPEVYLARASSRATLHLFDAALADLAEAEKRGAPPVRLLSPRAAIAEARGLLDEAWKLRRAAREQQKNLQTLGAEAALLGQMRRFDEAERLFAQAEKSHRDVSPFPVAWLFFQEATTWERAGKIERARAYYAAAVERLPGYAHAAMHLATLSPPDRAVDLLTPIVEVSDDPEIELVLAQRLRMRGDVTGADQRLAHVRARFDALVAARPEAFAEHAGFFYLDEGHDSRRALALAKQNLALRKTEKAYELALLAATAEGGGPELCAIGTEAQRLRYASEMLRSIAAGACNPR
ncbi:MAG: hypothetical protein U0359_18945 [Byssovorax sp.]